MQLLKTETFPPPTIIPGCLHREQMAAILINILKVNHKTSLKFTIRFFRMAKGTVNQLVFEISNEYSEDSCRRLRRMLTLLADPLLQVRVISNGTTNVLITNILKSAWKVKCINTSPKLLFDCTGRSDLWFVAPGISGCQQGKVPKCHYCTFNWGHNLP